MKKFFLKSLFTFAIVLCASPILANEEKNTIVKPLLAEDDATLSGISHNGKWAVGYAYNNSDNAGFNISASLWNLSTYERTILATEEDGMSEANCVNDEGTIIGGSYLHEPAYYTNGEWHILEMPDGYTMGTVIAMTIVNTDTIFVGRVQDSDEAQSINAAKWVNGKYERANPNSIRRDHLGDPANVNTCYGISEDGKIIMGCLEYNARPNATPFVTTPDTAFIIETANELNKNLSFIWFPKMSANGKYITGAYRHVIYHEGETYASTDTYQPCLFDIETQRFQIFEKEGYEWAGNAVDNNGVVYAKSPFTEHPYSQGYIIANGDVKELETLLREKGVSDATIDAASAPAEDECPNKLGTIIAVSRDGKTIIGCAGQCVKYNWVVKIDTDEVSYTPISYDKLAAFYNNGTIILSGMVDAIEVYSVNGALIMNQSVESAFIPAQLEEGIYIIKLYNNTTNTISSSKFIVK